MSNFFTIFAHGKDFDVDSYVKYTSLKIDRTWAKGEEHPKSNGVEIYLGQGRELALFEQYEITIDYLRNNKSKLKRLAGTSGVSTFILGLHYCLILKPGLRGFCMAAPRELNSLALNIGIDPVFYVDINPIDEDE